MEANSAANSDRLYEDFEPDCKWVRGEGEGHDVAELRLPGFKREQITIKINHLGFVVISGEHPSSLGEPKWRRFVKELRVPEYCYSDAIRAKFSDHILSVIMPKKIVEDEDDKEMERAEPDTEVEPRKKKIQFKGIRKKVQFKDTCALQMKKGEVQVWNGTKALRLAAVFAVLIALGGYLVSKYGNFIIN